MTGVARSSGVHGQGTNSEGPQNPMVVVVGFGWVFFVLFCFVCFFCCFFFFGGGVILDGGSLETRGPHDVVHPGHALATPLLII